MERYVLIVGAVNRSLMPTLFSGSSNGLTASLTVECGAPDLFPPQANEWWGLLREREATDNK